MNNKIRCNAVSALMVALSLSLFAVELLIPPFPFAPSAKIGLANIVTLFMITNRKFFKTRDCLMVLICRCTLASLITGRVLSVLFSLAGGISALFAMHFTYIFFNKKYTVAVSITGAVVHNLVQIAVAVCIYGTFSALYYIPALFLSGIICGALTGLCVKIMNKNKLCNKIFK